MGGDDHPPYLVIELRIDRIGIALLGHIKRGRQIPVFLDRFLKDLGPEIALGWPAVPVDDAEEEQDESGQEDDFNEFPLGTRHLLLCPHGSATFLT